MVSIWRRRWSSSALAALRIAAGRFDLAAAGFQFLRHAVEGAHQVPDFIGGADVHAIIQTSAGNLLRRLGQRRQRPRHQLGEKQRQPCGHEQHHHGQQQEQAHVGAAHQPAFTANSK